MPTLKQLRYYDALVKFNHFGKAAGYCSVTQPALSVQLQELEKELGIQLIERRYKDVRITKEGEEIARRANSILAAVKDLEIYAKHSQVPLSGPLQLGVIPTLAPYILPALLPKVMQHYPQLELKVRESQTETLVAELSEGKLDLLLLALPIEGPEFLTHELFEDRFLMAVPNDHVSDEPIDRVEELLQGDRLLLLEEGHCMRDQALSYCQFRQIDNVDTFGASSLSTLAQMVANGLGTTLLPEISIAVEANDEKLTLLRFSDPQPSRKVGLVWRKTSARQSDFVELGNVISEAAGLEQKTP